MSLWNKFLSIVGVVVTAITPILIKYLEKLKKVHYADKNDARNDDIKSHIDRMRAKDNKAPKRPSGDAGGSDG